MSMEIITMQDKDKRDAMYQDLRRNGDELEHQVVRFSGYEQETIEIISDPGTPNLEVRPVYRQTWSVAYPRS